MTTCEALATKAELQELRDQLNAILGEKEGGGVEQVFEKGKSPTVALGAMGVTAFLATKTRALSAITDITLGGTASNVIHADFARGATPLQAVKGSGQVSNLVQLNKVAKLSGQNTLTSTLAAKAGEVSGSGLVVLSNLVTLAATLGLNIATVNILDSRIDAEARGAQNQFDAVNSSMLRLYDKNQGDIAAVVQELDANNAVTQANKQALATNRIEIQELQAANSELYQRADAVDQSIQKLQTQHNDLVAEINASNLETQEILDSLTAQMSTVQNQLTEANKIIAQQQEAITKLEEKVTALETKVSDLEDKILRVELQYIHLREEFWRLEEDLNVEIDLTNDRITTLEGKVAKAQKFVQQNRGVGSSGAVTKASAQTQDGLLKLTSKLTGDSTQPSEITEADIYNDTNAFRDAFENLLPNVGTETMTNEQMEDLRKGWATDFEGLLGTSLGATVIPRLDTIGIQTQAPAISAAVQQGLCQSLNSPNPCGASAGNPNPTQGLRGMQQAAQAQSNALLQALGAADLLQGQSILSVVRNTNAVVNHAQHGLAKVQTFAQTAWKATQADKILAGVSMALTIHNAMMLSNNLLLTMSEATNMTLDALGIRDETDAPIDFSRLVKGKIAAVLTNILGAEQYAALTARIAKANRIYQASVNVLDTTQALFDSARSVAELTAENMGKIGNALRESGAVYEDAYEEFAEKVSPQNRAQRNLEKFRGSIEGVSNVFETIEGISSNVVEFQENATQLKEEKKEWREELDKKIEVKVTEKTEAKGKLQVDADITKADFGKAETED